MSNLKRTFYDSKEKRWHVDFGNMRRLIARHSHAVATFSAVNSTGKSVNATGYSAIKLTHMDYNRKHAKVLATTLRMRNYLKYSQLVYDDPKGVQEALAAHHAKVPLLRSQINRLFEVSRSDNKTAVGLVNDFGKGYRDAGLTVLFAAGGAAASGAYAVGLNATKAVIDGAVKYHDTGNLGAALITTTGGMVMIGCSALGDLVDDAGKPIIAGFGLALDGVFEIGGQAAEGKSIQEALKAAMIKTVLGAASSGIKVKGTTSKNLNEKTIKQIIENHKPAQAIFKRAEAQINLAVGLSTKAMEKTAGDMLASKEKKKASVSKGPKKTGGNSTSLRYVRRKILRRI